MPIRIICEKRHHLNETDMSIPVIFCDLCGKRITDASKANFCWRVDSSLSEEVYYDQKCPVYFLHCECSRRVRSVANRGKSVLIETPFGVLDTESVNHSWEPLEAFPIWLGLNAGMNINADQTKRYKPSEQYGIEISASSYPENERGWVYFIVDNGSIETKVKIGFSTNVYARLKALQTGSPTILRCYGAVPGEAEQERFAQQALESHRSHGEWFFFHKVRAILDEWLGLGKVCVRTLHD